MKKLFIEKTICSPLVVLDKEKGQFEISGKSLPEDAFGFYQAIIDWFLDYLKNPNVETVLKIDLIYFNTASAKMLFEIFELFSLSYQKGDDLIVQWCFDEDDEDIMEAGQDFADMGKVPFKFKAVECA